jgi:hypothetical protein
MIKFLQHRIADRRILRLIQKWLRAGVSEDGEWSKTVVGTPQGSVISPLLANVYLHYVFDLWAQHWRKHRATGEVIVVRYADDSVLGFQHRADAERFLQEWKERLQKFGLELHPDKTRLIEFGRFAALSRKKHGEGKPETFNFLGFTHICGQDRKNGKFLVRRKSIRKRLLAKLKQVKDELRLRMHQPLADIGKWLRSVVQGYFNYHAVPGNSASLQRFRREVSKRWLRVMQRRSQKCRISWKHMTGFAAQWLPRPKILHICASMPSICGKSRMQENCPCGSVRGALGNRRPYRDSKYGSKRCLGRTEADREIMSEPWSSMQRSKRTRKTTLRSERRSVLKKYLTEPTLLSRWEKRGSGGTEDETVKPLDGI